MSLDDWLSNGWLKRHETSRQEIAELFAEADQDLTDASGGISPGWAFAIAYNAVMRLSSILLFAQGFRATRDQKHYRTIAAIPLALGENAKTWADYFDRCRIKRNEVTYETATLISQSEADELISEVRQFTEEVKSWLKVNHADLIDD